MIPVAVTGLKNKMDLRIFFPIFPLHHLYNEIIKTHTKTQTVGTIKLSLSFICGHPISVFVGLIIKRYRNAIRETETGERSNFLKKSCTLIV